VPRSLLVRDIGGMGVELFFVLSGFLITGILLDARADAEAMKAPRRGVLRRFYIRRFLRIFPLYYTIILVGWVLHSPYVRAHVFWLLGYGTNFLMVLLDQNIGVVTPFWSLAVEEQFYLCWPFIVLFMPYRKLPWILGGMVAVAVVSRCAIALAHGSHIAITAPTWSNLDGLALGGLLALAHRSRRDVYRAMRAVLVCGVLLETVRLTLVALAWARPVRYALWMLPWALVCVWAVDRAARDQLPAIFRWRVLIWLGTISYGVYVFHSPVAGAMNFDSRHGWSAFAIVTAATFVVASVSWIAFERPINNLKRHWPYVRPPRAPASVVAAPAAVSAETRGVVGTLG
jgi:peptidoglycan/LPS O-acetylase OafA/YrhL